MNTLLKYPGSKWRIAEWIISHFPEHKVYCEPFFGSGAVFFSKQPVYIETINDLDGDVVNLFRVCRDHPEKLAQLIELTPFARDEFSACYERSNDPIEQARRTIVRYHQSFGTSNSSRNSWRNVQTYGGPRCATTMSDEKHIELLEVLKASSSKIIISGYESELYNRELEGWDTDTIQTTAQMGLHRTEKIWANFDFDLQLKIE